MSAPRLARPWLDLPLPGRLRTLGWCLNAPGFGWAAAVHWREVRDADLGPDLDVPSWLAADLSRTGRAGPCFVTSRDVSAFVLREARVEGAGARALATVGLSNAERIGARSAAPAALGTINVALVLDAPLSDGALVEVLSLAAQARTAAVMEGGPRLPGGAATGTGTDCLLVAAPAGEARHAGMHTALGEAAGRAAFAAVARGVADWMEMTR